MLIAASSINGSPGVSAWALLIAAALPGDHVRVLVEADAAGGVLATRYGIDAEPGVISLVSHARLHPDQTPSLESCGRRLDDRLWCVPGPETAEGAGHIWGNGAEPLAQCLSADDRLWIVDCGRIYPNSPLAPLFAAASLHLVFTGSSTESLVAVPSRVHWLSEYGPTCVISVGDSGRRPSELLEFFGSERVWQVPYHRDLAKVAGQAASSGRARRSKPWRTAVEVADNIFEWLSHQANNGDSSWSGGNGLSVQPTSVPTIDRPAINGTDGAVPTQTQRVVSPPTDSVVSPLHETPTGVVRVSPPLIPSLPGDEFRAAPVGPPLPPVSAKAGWHEPMPDWYAVDEQVPVTDPMGPGGPTPGAPPPANPRGAS